MKQIQTLFSVINNENFVAKQFELLRLIQDDKLMEHSVKHITLYNVLIK